MKKVIYNIGDKFNKWTVLEEVYNEKYKRWYYKCSCECGTIKTFCGTKLKLGQSKQCKKCYMLSLNNFEDLTGKTFGKYTVVKYIGVSSNYKRMYECICVCKNLFEVDHFNLKNNLSGGCRRCTSNKRHQMSKTSTYRIWAGMKQRCHNEKNPDYIYYGGRGITVCERWLDSFDNFLEDMGERPSKLLSIDRINVNLGYFKDNCRWATIAEQSWNKQIHGRGI